MALATLGTIVLSLLLFTEFYSRYKARGLPPGSVGIRWLIEIPRKHAWEKFLEMGQKYGDICIGSAFGKHIVIVHSATVAQELLEKRGTKYADRPRSVMGGELSGWKKTMLLANYTNEFRDQRKWIAQEIGSNAAVANFQDMISEEFRRTLRMILENPEKVEGHLRKYHTSVVLRISHGYISQDGDLEDDPLTKLGDLAVLHFNESTSVGRHIVDLFYPLKYVPSWLPGAGFKRRAKHFRVTAKEQLELPLIFAKSQIAAGTALPSLYSRLMGKISNISKETQENIAWAASSVFRGGLASGTSLSYAFILAMILYPDVMKKARREIDSEIGGGRLPIFADRPSLPYCECVFAELLRWQGPAGLTLRGAAVDDEYNGYLIPAGSIMIINIWAMLRDERVYKDPRKFNPDRFIGENPEPLPYNVCFGFGRRRCPGYILAQSTVWLTCVQMLAVFDFSKHVENGVEITPEVKHYGMTIIYQAPFKCSIKPRSKEAEQLIKEQISA